MLKHLSTAGQLTLWSLLAIGLIILNGGSVIGDNPPASRWSRVDLTQYCEKTVGELIDSLGDDYEGYSNLVIYNYRDDYDWLMGFMFQYKDAVISIYPTGFVYCNPDLRKGDPAMEDIRRELIARIRLTVR